MKPSHNSQDFKERNFEMSSHYSNKMLNSEQLVLVEGFSKKSDQEYSGRTENNRVVNFKAPDNVIGKFVQLKITDVYANSLRGAYLETLS